MTETTTPEAVDTTPPLQKPVGWATIVRGRVANVGPYKPRCPGEDGWSYWAERGYEAPQPIYLGFPELTLSEVEAIRERRRQVAEEGYSTDHDDQYTEGELPRAAAVYALKAAGVAVLRALPFWPWDRRFLKTDDDDRCLDKAIALLLAEKERRKRVTTFR